MSDDLGAFISRLEKVEKSNRRLRMMGFTALLIAAVSLLLPPAIRTVCRAAKIYPTLAVSGVTVYDEDGALRGYFGYPTESQLDLDDFEHFPFFMLMYPDGMPAIMLSVDESGPEIGVSDEDGLVDASLRISSFRAPSLFLRNKEAVAIMSAEEDGVVLGARNRETKQSAKFQFSMEPPYLAISDIEKNTLWSAP